MKGLTNNGRRGVKESKSVQLRRYLLLLAEDEDSLADVVLSPAASPELSPIRGRIFISVADGLTLRNMASDMRSARTLLY